MKVKFFDLQDSANRSNGTRVQNAVETVTLMRSLRHRPPFMFRFDGDTGVSLLVGQSSEQGCVQYSKSDGSPPYYMALDSEGIDEGGFIEFLTGNTPTPISRRYCMPLDRVEKIVSDFITTGEKSSVVDWEEI